MMMMVLLLLWSTVAGAHDPVCAAIEHRDSVSIVANDLMTDEIDLSEALRLIQRCSPCDNTIEGMGCSIDVKPGRYLVSEALVVCRENVHLDFNGSLVIVTDPSSNGLEFLRASACADRGFAADTTANGSEVENLRIKSSSTAPTRTAGVLIHSSEVTLRNVRVERFGQGVRAVGFGRRNGPRTLDAFGFETYEDGQASHVLLDNVSVLFNWADGFYVDGKDANVGVMIKPNATHNCAGWTEIVSDFLASGQGPAPRDCANFFLNPTQGWTLVGPHSSHSGRGSNREFQYLSTHISSPNTLIGAYSEENDGRSDLYASQSVVLGGRNQIDSTKGIVIRNSELTGCLTFSGGSEGTSNVSTKLKLGDCETGTNTPFLIEPMGGEYAGRIRLRFPYGPQENRSGWALLDVGSSTDQELFWLDMAPGTGGGPQDQWRGMVRPRYGSLLPDCKKYTERPGLTPADYTMHAVSPSVPCATTGGVCVVRPTVVPAEVGPGWFLCAY